MADTEADWVSVAGLVFSSIAATGAIIAAVAAVLAYMLQRSLAKSRQRLIKGDVLLKNIQSLIVTFADVRATAKEDSSPQRAEKLRLLSRDLRYIETVIKSLHPGIGEKFEHWHVTPDDEGCHVSGVVDYELGFLGADTGSKYERFFCAKAAELGNIQDDFFEEINA